jgi:hypothetical protein
MVALVRPAERYAIHLGRDLFWDDQYLSLARDLMVKEWVYDAAIACLTLATVTLAIWRPRLAFLSLPTRARSAREQPATSLVDLEEAKRG